MITKLNWNNYQQLGNLNLCFLKGDGTPYKNIVLAGENGTGKTAILDSLSTFLNLGSIEPFSSIEYIIDSKKYIDTPEAEGSQHGFHTRRNVDDGTTKHISVVGERNKSRISDDKEDIRGYGCAYSRAKSGFLTNPVRSTTTMQLDSEKHFSDQSSDYTSIKQLLVDIYYQDAGMLFEEAKKNGVVEYSPSNTKLNRFTESFNNFFDELEFSGIDTSSDQELKIVFLKHGTSVAIDDLSTGEKQIVFRGASLLKDCNAIKNGVVLIDEPELSLHPKWQAKILSFYIGLFDENTQVIVATHSEYVIREALEHSDDTLVIVLTDDNGVVKTHRITSPFSLPSITAAETNYLAFGINSSDYHIQLYGYYQSKFNLTTVKACDESIMNSNCFDETKHKKVSHYGSTTYYTLPTYIRNAIDHPDNGNKYSEAELSESIELLIKLCK